MENNLYILTGPIRSGKTTALGQWIQQFDHVGGLLTPDGENGLRLMVDIGASDQFPFQMADHEEGQSVDIGRFRFWSQAFEKGNKILLDCLHKAPEHIIIDEWGKLEKRGEGLAEGCNRLISAVLKREIETKLIVVVRDSLYDEFVQHCQQFTPKGEEAYEPKILDLPTGSFRDLR